MKASTVLLILWVALCASAAAQQAPTGVRPLASVRQLHDIVITPVSDAVFRSAGESPTSDQAWLEARNQALLLAEAGNLLMIGSRARDNAGWMRMSRALVDAAAAAAAAADRKDATALESSGDAITVACEACHQPYRDGGREMRGNGAATPRP